MASRKPQAKVACAAARDVDGSRFPAAMEKSPAGALWTEWLKRVGESR